MGSIMTSIAPDLRSANIHPHRAQSSQLTPEGVSYRVWAPNVSIVEAEIERGESVWWMKLAKDEEGYHSGVDPTGRAGDCYRFRLDGKDSYPDPASRWQPFGV